MSLNRLGRLEQNQQAEALLVPVSPNRWGRNVGTDLNPVAQPAFVPQHEGHLTIPFS